MTRINLVPPCELMDQHLFAEFREIKMVPMSLKRSIMARGIEDVLAKIPDKFTLNKGHVSFFYDKGFYLKRRYEAIMFELGQRDINFNSQSEFDPFKVYEMDWRLMKEYIPDEKALLLIRTRISEKIAMKPDWYRYYGIPRKSL